MGASAPAACYDHNGDPAKRISCGEISIDPNAETQPPSKKIRAHFSRPAERLPRAQVRVVSKRSSEDSLRITVELRVQERWIRVWRQDMGHLIEAPFVSVWPTPRGDRALLLFKVYEQGPFTTTQVHWVSLPAR